MGNVARRKKSHYHTFSVFNSSAIIYECAARYVEVKLSMVDARPEVLR